LWHKRYIRSCKSKPNQESFDLIVGLPKMKINEEIFVMLAIKESKVEPKSLSEISKTFSLRSI